MKRILIVEDDDSLRRVLQVIFEREGYAVGSSASTEQAIGRLLAEAYDLVITDYEVGLGPTGLDLLRFVKEHLPGTPVLLMSGSAGTGLSDRARDLGAYSFFAKPLDICLLKEICREATSQSASRRFRRGA